MVSKTATPAADGTVTVLVVEDEPSLAMLESEMLERAGFKVEQVTLGSSALGILDSQEIAAVVTDYTMPDMTGADFLAALRGRPTVPVIAVTGHSDPEVEKQMRAAGVFEFLFKDPGLKFLSELPRMVAAAIAAHGERPFSPEDQA